MKTIIKAGLFILSVVFLAGCAGKPVKTIENLKYAFNGESTASAKYAAFAEKARAEGFDTIAIMFTATSKSESIHAANHKKVLEKLGVKIDGPEIGKFNVLTTKENLDDAHRGETGEIDVMYPGFIATANKEKAADAVKSFTWAFDTEKKHKAFYQKAMDALSAGGEKTLSAVWYVCPTCGNTYDSSITVTACDFCMTPRSKFLTF
jgi:rubrerythrin